MKIRISSIESESRVNGPGSRAVVWVQGCSIGRTNPCKGCFNAHTWTLTGGKEMDTMDLALELRKLDVRGVTFSGGDPMDQVEAIIDIIDIIKSDHPSLPGTPKDTMIFTGFEIEEILADKIKRKIVEWVDLLKTGRYKPEFHSNETPWRGSTNQQLFYLTDKIKKEEEQTEERIELTIKANGVVRMTGFPSKELIAEVKKL